MKNVEGILFENRGPSYLTTFVEWIGGGLYLYRKCFRFLELRALKFWYDLKTSICFGAVMKTFRSLRSGTRSIAFNSFTFHRGSITEII